MKFKMGILFDDSKIKDKDMSDISKGNPGVGGTLFCYLMLMKYLNVFDKNININVYTYGKNNNNKYPTNVNISNCDSREACVRQAKDDNVDVLLINFTDVKHINNVIKEKKIKSIVWVHNLINGNTTKLLSSNKYYVRVILLGNQHYDRYIDDGIIKKCTVIPNMVNRGEPRVSTLENNVTYTGALVKSKGFHALAKIWKDVLKEVPDANLFVIGTGALYNSSQKLGTYGIAEDAYEKSFMRYLIDDGGNILESVHFLGLLGDEKNDIYKKTKVGVVNPTAKTEVCPISVLEMAAYGIPVVSKGKNGVPDTIINRKSGILIHNSLQLKKAIINLLKNNQMNLEMSLFAKNFIQDERTPEAIIPMWIDVIEDVIYEKSTNVKYCKPQNYYFNNGKWIKIINHFLRFNLGIKFIPSVVRVEYQIKRIIKGDSNL